MLTFAQGVTGRDPDKISNNLANDGEPDASLVLINQTTSNYLPKRDKINFNSNINLKNVNSLKQGSKHLKKQSSAVNSNIPPPPIPTTVNELHVQIKSNEDQIEHNKNKTIGADSEWNKRDSSKMVLNEINEQFSKKVSLKNKRLSEVKSRPLTAVSVSKKSLK